MVLTNYVKTTNFTAKDSLVTGDPGKLVKGYDFDVEFDNLATAVATKADLASPSLTGTPTAPTAASGTATTQLATTAYVYAERSNTATLTNKTISGGSITGITDLAVADGGTGASDAASARANLGVPATDGTNATGNWGINVTGSSASVSSGSWTVSVSGTNLLFSYSGTAKAKLDSSGNLTVVGDITAFGSV